MKVSLHWNLVAYLAVHLVYLDSPSQPTSSSPLCHFPASPASHHASANVNYSRITCPWSDTCPRTANSGHRCFSIEGHFPFAWSIAGCCRGSWCGRRGLWMVSVISAVVYSCRCDWEWWLGLGSGWGLVVGIFGARLAMVSMALGCFCGWGVVCLVMWMFVWWKNL